MSQARRVAFSALGFGYFVSSALVLAQGIPPAAPGTNQSGPGRATTSTILRADAVYTANGTGGRENEVWHERLKAIPLGRGLEVSLSGLGHAQAEFFDNQNFGQVPGGDGFFNTRLNLYGDLNFARRVRVFGALKHGERFLSPVTLPVDSDDLDLHQLFFELRVGDLFGMESTSLFLRAGRQELHYGAGRMISIREGPNLRDEFDGALVRARFGLLVLDGFAVFDVTDETGTFDNRTQTSDGVWGAYGCLELGQAGNLDFYYIGDERSESSYVQGILSETRHSTGIRWWRGASSGWSGDLELTVQFGQARDAEGERSDILAWSASGDILHSWGTAVWSPSVGGSFGVSSGDEQAADSMVGTFRAPEPPGRYFGETNPLGPGNIAGGSVKFEVSPMEGWRLTSSVIAFWRLQTADGVYNPAGGVVRGAQGDRGFVGWEPSILTSYRLDSVWTLGAEGGYFFPGPYLEDNLPSDGVLRLVSTVAVSF